MTTEKALLASVRRTARRARAATDDRNTAIAAARAAGLTLRAIADEADLTHAGVAKILAKGDEPTSPS